jgi:prolipoprotein diacylglyceryltransferase
LADGLLPLLGTLSIAAWLGSWSDGSAYGQLSDAWYALPARDEWGAIEPRLPVQLCGALLTLVLFASLEQARRWLRHPGLSASLGLLGWALICFGLSFLRADPAQTWSGLRLEAWGQLVLAGVGLVWLAIVLLRSKLKSREK